MNIDPSFFVTALIVVLIPGTGVLFTVSTSISRGRKAALWASIGCTLGIVPHLLATVLGVAALLHTSAIAFQCVKYAGALYLIYIAISTIRDQGTMAMSGDVSPQGRFSIMFKAILMNILNPKLTIFFLAFLPQFIRNDGSSHFYQLSILSLIFMVMTFGVFALYGFLADRFRSVVLKSPSFQKWMKRVIAGTFASMGLKLALSEG